MEMLKKHIHDLTKTKGINTQFQNKLGEITIWLNPIQTLDTIPDDQINLFITLIQSFLCHNFYTEYIKVKTNENSTYDNCMNLILIILAKVSKFKQLYTKFMFNSFIKHINQHLECFNYIISFYRLYITCPQLKQVGKSINIYTYLFEIYKKVYEINLQIEPGYKLKDMKSILKNKIIKHLNMSYDKKFLFENYLQLTDRPGRNANTINSMNNNNVNSSNNNNNNNNNIVQSNLNNNINSNNSNNDTSLFHHQNTFQFQSDFHLIHTKKPSSTTTSQNIQIASCNTPNMMVSSHSSNITVSNINCCFQSHQSKSNLLSRTERKSSNTRLSGEIQGNTAEISLSSKEHMQQQQQFQMKSGGGIKTKIPLLKFPMDKSQPQHRYSIIRSSHRAAEFSKSGDGGSTTTTKNNNYYHNIGINNKLLNLKNVEGSSMNRNSNACVIEPKEKLKALAMQLGESCLATGLAALINQNRDMELGKIKKSSTNINNNPNTNNSGNISNNNISNNNMSCSSNQKSPKTNKYIEKLKSNNSNISNLLASGGKAIIDTNNISYDLNADNTNNNNNNNSSSSNVNNNNNNNNKDKNSKYDTKRSCNNFCNKSDNCLIEGSNSINNNNNGVNYSNNTANNTKEKSSSSYSLNFTQNQKYKNFLKIREILTNFIISSLKEYSIEDYSYLNINTNVIYGYLLLPSLEAARAKTERKNIEMIEHIHSLYNDYQHLSPTFISNGLMLYSSDKITSNILTKFDLSSSFKQQHIASPIVAGGNNKNVFESFLSITFEEENNCPLVLKSEYLSLYDILQLHTTNIENVIKQQIHLKNMQCNMQLISNGIYFSEMNALCLENIRKHIDPFLDVVKNKICFLLRSCDISNCYSSLISSGNCSSSNCNNNNNNSSTSNTPYSSNNNINYAAFDVCSNDDYIMKVLKQQIDILNDYITCKSRVITIHVLIHLSDMLLILKKCFIQIFSMLSSVYDKNNAYNSNNINNNNNNADITERYDMKLPDKLLDTFCSFVSLISNIIARTKIYSEYKFINDIFISCSSWLSLCKFIFEYFLLTNLTSSSTVNASANIINNSTNINNQSNNTFSNIKLDKSASNTQRVSNNGNNTSSGGGGCNNNNNNTNSNSNSKLNNINIAQILRDDNTSNIRFCEPLCEHYKTTIRHALTMVNFFYTCNNFYHNKILSLESTPLSNSSLTNTNTNTNAFTASTNLNSNTSSPSTSSSSASAQFLEEIKYWHNSIKEYLSIVNYFLNSKTGVVYDIFISTTGANFVFSKIKLSIIFSHFNFLSALLFLQESSLNFKTQYSSLVNEMTSLDLIRLHYISFIKLYNKNIIFNPNLTEVSTIIANCEKVQKKKTIKAFVKDVNNDQNLLNIIIYLCKMHLRCLFSLSKNRCADVTNKFFQLKIVDYMTKEIELEHEVVEKIYKMNQFGYGDGNKNNNNSNSNTTTINVNSVKGNEMTWQNQIAKQSGIPSIKLNLNFEKEGKNGIIEKLEKEKKKGLGMNLSLQSNDNNNSYISDDDDNFNDIDLNGHKHDDSDFEDEEYDDIPLVEPTVKTAKYDDKVPKLVMIPTTFGGEFFGVQNKQMLLQQQQQQQLQQLQQQHEFNKGNQVTFAAVQNEKEGKEVGKDSNKESNCGNNNNNNNGKSCVNNNNNGCGNNNTNEIQSEKPKIKLKLNLNLCKSTKNDKLKELLKQREENEQKQNEQQQQQQQQRDVNVNINNNQEVKKEVKLPKLNICINNNNNNTNNNRSPKNVEIDISKDTHIQQDTITLNNNNTNTITNANNTKKNQNSILASKIQVEIENHLKQKYNLFYQKALSEGLTEHDLGNVSQFYLKERNSRLLYQDTELQVLILSLIFSLIITPSRGTLDELYCSIFPYESNKLNILYIIHHHLNRAENEHLLPLLLTYISQITPFGAGQRLLKLLSKKLFDISLYTNWEKIAGGQFGTVYQCNTNLKEPNIVAIKKIELEQNIFSPCHLFDIFTEITALESFRLENCVTQLFDYGCDEENYYIVMKRYPISLKQWRIKQTLPFTEMLPTYLSIFKDILEAVKIIHTMNTTHYDIKCDNIVIDFLPNNNTNCSKDLSNTTGNEDDICIRVADFGECRIFLNEKDEYCTRSRGTDVIKSPEMLKHIGYQVRTEDDNYDRRRKMGTTRSSDIWSLGCLFYELLTGNFLFEEINDNYLGFSYQIDKKPISELLTDEKMLLIDKNPYLTDFLKFMLVKDQNYRPNIEAVIRRFEHVYALLVGGTGLMVPQTDLLDNGEYASKRYNDAYFESCIDTCEHMINNTEYIWNNNNNILSREALFTGVKSIPEIFALTNDIYCAQYDYIEDAKNSSNIICKLFNIGITHIISWTKTRNRDIHDKFSYLNLIDACKDVPFTQNCYTLSPFPFLFKTIDFLRNCMVYKGKVLFIDDYFYTSIPNKPNFLIRALILIIFSKLLNQNAYDTYTYLNSKLLFFTIPITHYLPQLSTWVMYQHSIISYLSSFPIYRCFCGACQLILKRTNNLRQSKKCNCQYGHSSQQYSECPSNGCNEYIGMVKKFYGVNYEWLNWCLVSCEDFFFGWNEGTNISTRYMKKIALCSSGYEDNLVHHSLNDKYSMKASGRKNSWALYKCKICHCWMFGECMEKILILGNNEYHYSQTMEIRKKMVKSKVLKELTLEQMI